jgi:opacity protein-like surface antigen
VPTLRKVISILAALALAPTAGAFEPAYDYANLRGGLFVPQGSSVRDFQSGPDVELAVGRAFLTFLAAEVAVGYASAETGVHAMRYPAPTYTVVDMREGYQIVPFTATVKVVLPAGSIEPWIGGGAGAVWARIHRDPTGDLATVSESDTAFEYHAGGGATLRLAARWFAGLDARYAFTKVKWFNEGKVALDGLRVSLALGTRF